jgi:hypothetical protein
VEATSVTPFASRARDRAMHAVLVSMIRHGDRAMLDRPALDRASDSFLEGVVSEIERRVQSIDAREIEHTREELDDRLDDWLSRAPNSYFNPRRPDASLLQSAERYARRRAAGRLGGAAWPTMNNMRSVEPSTPFRMTEVLASGRAGQPAPQTPTTNQSGDNGKAEEVPVRRWRRRNGG